MKFAFRSEQALRLEVYVLLLSIPLAWLVGLTALRRVELVAVILLLLTIELLNTAVEKLADRLTLEHDPQIGQVKDMGSAAVAGALLIAGLTWLAALGERAGLF